MPATSSPIQAAAPSSSTAVAVSRVQPRVRGEAMTAPPNPMPRMNDISTMAKACSEAPKSSTSERADSTSRPIETAPVKATMRNGSEE